MTKVNKYAIIHIIIKDNVRGNMNKKLEVYYENQFEVFLKQGWKDFMEDIKNLQSTMTIDSVTNEQELYFRKGQKDILSWLLSRESFHSDAYEQLLKEEDEYAEDV